MQRRPIIYLLAIVIIILVVINHNDQKQEELLPVISREQIFEDFKNQTGEVWLNFPASFTGTSGELFYLGQELNEKPVTKVYRIYRPESGELYYELHDEWDNVKLPANQFETYYLVEGEWIKTRK
ncbi:MAG: hypothetical protein WAO57_08060 [Syntrophomonadaceae bacterium]|mgnify:FL=1|jgi:hypothetical protein|nr:hypothetical protein [Bacillota bacterium]